MSEESSKILICGDIGGSFDQLFKRVNGVNKNNGPFKMLLCIGSFFEPYTTEIKNEEDLELPKELEPYKSGKEISPIPIYFISYTVNDAKYIKKFTDDNGLLCENIHYLGKTGIKEIESINIAYLSGKVDFPVKDDPNLDPLEMTITKSDIENIISQSKDKRIDVLLTNQWPRHIFNNLNEIPSHIKNPFKKGMDGIKDVTLSLNPAYHFSRDSFYYQRPPFLNNSQVTKVTRFLSLATVYNDQKEKYLFAMNYQPNKEISLEDSTPNPLENLQHSKKKQRNNFEGESTINPNTNQSPNFFFGNQNPHQQFNNNNNNNQNPHQQFNSNYNNNNNQNPRKRKLDNHHNSKIDTNCWFCLSSPQVESHLIVTVGSENYLAFSKGGICKEHLLIVFIEHKPSFISLEPNEKEDVEKFIKSLREYFNSKGEDVVIFERNAPLKGAVSHGHLQVVPIPKSIGSDKVKEKFIEHAKEIQIDFKESNNDQSLYEELKDQSYFLVFLPDGKKIYTTYPSDKKFDFQFGRKVIVQLLNCPERLNWKNCVESKESETDLTVSFREKFDKFYQSDSN